MKKVTLPLLALLLAVLPITGFAAASDVLFSQKNASNTAWSNVIVPPVANGVMSYSSAKVPISSSLFTFNATTGLLYAPSVSDAGGTTSAQRNALAPAQGLVFDGSANCAQAVPADGTSNFTKAVFIYLTLQPTGDFSLTSTVANASTFIVKNGTRRLSMAKYAVGYVASTSATDIPLGVWTFCAVTRTAGVDTYYLNGVADGTSADIYDYTAAGTAALGQSAPTGSAIRPVASYNRALSAAEVLTLYQTGSVASGDINNVTNDSGASVGASNTSLITGANSTFASATGWWTLAGGTPPTISGGVANFANGSSLLQRDNFLKIGCRYTVTVGTITGGGFYFNGGVPATPLSAGVPVTFTATQVLLQFFTGGAAGTIDNVTLTALGALIAPEANAPGNGLVWNDVSGNGAPIVLSTTGIAWNLPGNGQNRIRGATSTNGNQQLLAAPTINTAVSGWTLVRVRARALSGTPSVTLGTSSGGTTLVTSVALTANWKQLTIAASDPTFAISAATSLWVGSNSTDIVQWDISIEPISAI